MVESPGWRSWARPAADGTFAVRGLPPGRYKLTAHGQGSMAQQEDVATGSRNVRLRLAARR
jgi:hypothetical protein